MKIYFLVANVLYDGCVEGVEYCENPKMMQTKKLQAFHTTATPVNNANGFAYQNGNNVRIFVDFLFTCGDLIGNVVYRRIEKWCK